MTASHHRHVLSRSIASLLAIGALTSTGLAAVWTGAVSNDVNDPANWDVNPAGQNIYIGLVGNPAGPAPYTATLSANLAYAIVDLQVARTGGPALFNHTAGTAATGGGNWTDVGTDGGTGTYNLANTATAGGILTGFGQGSGSLTTNRLYVGGVEFGGGGGTGTFNMNTSGTVTLNNDLVVGVNNGTGVANVDSGTMTTNGWNFIGKEYSGRGGNGTLNMSGGTITNLGARTFFGLGNSTGSMTMTGGTYNNTKTADNSTQFAVGVKNLANATPASITMSGGTINAERLFTIGGNEAFGGDGNGDFIGAGKGVVTVNGPTALVNVTGEFWVGNQVGSVGTLNLSAGIVQANNWIAIGRNGSTGTVNLSGSGQLLKTGNGNVVLGTANGGVGKIVQSGGTFNANNQVILGEFGSSEGIWEMTGGTANINELNLAIREAAKATVTLGGNAVLNTSVVRVGWGTTDGSTTQGILTIGTGSTMNVTGGGDTLQIGDNRGTGLLTMAGGTLNVTDAGSTMNLGWGGSPAGTVQHNAGFINLANNLVLNRDSSAAQVYNMAGGTLNAANVILGRGGLGSATFTQTAGNVNVSGSFDVQENQGGTYNLSGGTLSVNGALDLNGGSFNFSGGKITRSNAGVIDINGNFATLAAAATLKLDADKTFDISGNFNNTAGITLEVNGLGIADQPGAFFTPITGSFPLGFIGGTLSQPGDAFDIAFASVVGFDATFNVAGFGDFTAIRINEDDAFNPQTQSVYWVDEDAGVVTLQYSAVPEPATAGLLGLAGLSLALRRRRKA